MLMLEYLQEIKTMQSSNFDNYKDISEGLLVDDHENGIYGKDTAKNQSKYFFEEYEKTLRFNAGRWMVTNLLPLTIGGAGPTYIIFS